MDLESYFIKGQKQLDQSISKKEKSINTIQSDTFRIFASEDRHTPNKDS